jgi:toxin ParE1/3/4
MSYALELRKEAVIEFSAAFIWYEEQKDSLGENFKTEVDRKLKLICTNPYHYKSNYKNYHEAITDKFPFLIVYIINEPRKLVTVFAIFHTSRSSKKKYLKR